MLFNTSFNLAGEVIVETEEEAIDVVRRSRIEYLYLPEKQLLVTKKN
jgi:carbamoyltransferase